MELNILAGNSCQSSESSSSMKYVLVTGGVVSGLGKGVTASSIGVILKACGQRVTSIKIGTRLMLLKTSPGYRSLSFANETYISSIEKSAKKL